MKFFSKLGIVAAMALAGTAWGDAPDPSEVYVNSIAYAGSGCPAGSVAENISFDAKAFTLLFDEFYAEAGPGVSRRENRKNCQLLIDLHVPQGWSYSLFSVDYRGYVSLDRKVKALQKSSYYFQGSRDTASLTTNASGPIDDDYLITDTLGLSALVWKPCGVDRAININSQVRVNNYRNRRGSGLMTIDSIDGIVEHVFGISWKRCGGKKKKKKKSKKPRWL